MLSHRNVLMNTALTAVMHRRTEDDTVVTALPCAHVYGNVVMNGGFLYGAKLALIRRFDEIAILEAIQEHRATMFEGVPTAYMMLLAHPELGKHDLSSLTRCTVGGQIMPVAKGQEVEKKFGCPLLDLWGMTELAGLGTTHAWYAENRLGSIGVALPYVSVRIADAADAGKTMAPGDVGELMVKGPIVMQGYFGNEAATKETIEPDGWLHTGDLAKMDAEGYELAKAYVVLKPGAAASEDEILSFCRKELAAYKVPRTVQFVPALPMTSTGKLMRRELAKLDA